MLQESQVRRVSERCFGMIFGCVGGWVGGGDPSHVFQRGGSRRFSSSGGPTDFGGRNRLFLVF